MRRRTPTVPSVTRLLALGAACLALTSCDTTPSAPAVEAVGPLSLELIAGDGQSALPGQELPNPLVVSVTDSRGHKVRGQVVNFRVVEGDGKTFAGVAMTNSDGIARERWTLGYQGPQRLEARAIDENTGDAVTFGVFTATVIDEQAPVATDSVRPNPAQAADPVRLTATISDVTTGNSRIAGASFSIDGGAWVEMQPLDGELDSSSEVFEVVLPPFGAAGQHEVCARGSDASNNMSAVACETLVVLPPPPPARLVVTPDARNFGSVAVGAVVTQVFVVRNDGGLSAGDVSFSLSADAAPHYAIMSDSCNAPLAGGMTCSVTLRFQPTSAGPHPASLTIESQSGGSVEVALSGTGVIAAALSIAPASHDFGSQSVGSMSTPFAFVVTNTGGSPTGLLGPQVVGLNVGDFLIGQTSCSGVSLQPGGTCTVQITFRPSTTGPRTATLSIFGAGSATSTLTGTGSVISQPQLSIDPSSWDYGPVAVGQGEVKVFTIRNIGGFTISGFSWLVSGGNAADFDVIPAGTTCQINQSLGPGGQCAIAVNFNPSIAGIRTAALQLNWAGPTIIATLIGTGGTAPSGATLVALPPQVAFVSTPVGAASTQMVTVANSGSVPAQALVFSITSGGTHYSATSGGSMPCGPIITLNPGQSCTVLVTFEPQVAGTLPGILTFTSPSAASLAVQLTGTATVASGAALSISPSTVNYGNVAPGNWYDRIITVTNTSSSTTGPLTYSISGSHVADFIDNGSSCGPPLAPSASCTAMVTFAPTATGTRSATFTVIGNPGGSVAAPLTGVGVLNAPRLVIDPPSSFNFSAPVGQQSAPQSVRVINGSALSLATVTVQILNSPDFVIVQDNCRSGMPASESCDVLVAFRPLTPGVKSAQLLFSASGLTPASAFLNGITP